MVVVNLPFAVVLSCRGALEELVIGKVLIAHVVSRYVAAHNPMNYCKFDNFDIGTVIIFCMFTCMLVMMMKEYTLTKS